MSRLLNIHTSTGLWGGYGDFDPDSVHNNLADLEDEKAGVAAFKDSQPNGPLFPNCEYGYVRGSRASHGLYKALDSLRNMDRFREREEGWAMTG